MNRSGLFREWILVFVQYNEMNKVLCIKQNNIMLVLCVLQGRVVACIGSVLCCVGEICVFVVVCFFDKFKP